MSYALPSYALPSYALPSNALRLIRDYSKPLTRPDWRQSKPIISVYDLYRVVYASWDEDDLHYKIYRNIKNTYWYEIYWHIKLNNVSTCRNKFNITRDEIIQMGIHL